jgi:hypothetical protein
MMVKFNVFTDKSCQYFKNRHKKGINCACSFGFCLFQFHLVRLKESTEYRVQSTEYRVKNTQYSLLNTYYLLETQENFVANIQVSGYQ